MTTPLNYPRLIRRVRALLIDSVIIPVAALATLVAGESLGASGTLAKLLLIAVPVFILEPFMVSRTGGTIGHHLSGIRVTRQNGVDRLSLAAAIVRFLARLCFGWFSFVLVFATARRQALHDIAARSVVTLSDPAGLPPGDILHERPVEEAGFAYPAAWKRIMAIFVYACGAVVASAVLAALALSDACLLHDQCSSADYLMLLLANLLLFAAVAVVIVAGWRGRLPGCRRKPLS